MLLSSISLYLLTTAYPSGRSTAAKEGHHLAHTNASTASR